MTFDEYLGNLPLLHTWDGGQTWNTGGFEAPQLRTLVDFLRRELPSEPVVLETGAGNSTLAFTFLSPARQLAICPDEALFDRIRQFCQRGALPTVQLDARVGLSEWVLPELAARTREGGPTLDFALIDGGHNWPTVFVDFYYVHFMLRPGAYLMIDDVQLHSVKELARLLTEEPGFERVLDLGKSLVFRKISAARQLGDWNQSPYILRRSEDYMRLRNPFAL